MSTPTFTQGLEMLSLTYDVMSGKLTDPVEIGRRLAGLALDLVPVDDLKQYMTTEAARRADAVVDVIEDVKFR